MSNYNKSKGNTYERQLAKQLSDVFKLNFNRVPNSGAFVGGKNINRAQKLSEKQMLLMSGDIIVPEELAHVDFECKFYKELSFNSLFSNCELLNTWIKQASNTVKSLWFLFFKINHKGEFVVFDKKHYKLCKDIKNFFTYKDQYIICSADNFLENNKEQILSNNTL